MGRRRWAIVAGALLAALLAAVVLAGRGADLVGRSTRVADVGRWASWRMTYFWLDDRSLLLVTDSSGRPGPTLGAERIDCSSGAREHLTALEDTSAGKGVDLQFTSFSLSPGGKYLTWLGREPGAATVTWYASALDGSRRSRWPVTGSSYDKASVWLLDGLGWTIPTSGSPAAMTVYRLTEPEPVSVAHGYYTTMWKPLGFTGPTTGISFGPLRGRGTLTFAEWAIVPGAARRGTWEQQAPPGADRIPEAALSPDGRQLAYLAEYVPPYCSANLLRWRLPSCGQGPTSVSLWVSHTDGTGMRRIGSVHPRPPKPGDDLPGPLCLRWTPDGRRLSYVYEGSLYTVPAD